MQKNTTEFGRAVTGTLFQRTVFLLVLSARKNVPISKASYKAFSGTNNPTNLSKLKTKYNKMVLTMSEHLTIGYGFTFAENVV